MFILAKKYVFIMLFFFNHFTRVLFNILYLNFISSKINKSWKQQSSKKQLYGHLQTITKTIKIRRTRHTGHCWRSRDELISDVLQWTPSRGRAKAGQPAGTYVQQLCVHTRCSHEDLPEAMDDRERWRVRVRYLFTQPLRSGRIWHKVIFKAEFNRFQFRVFLLLD